MSDPTFPRAKLPPAMATSVVAAEAAEFERLRDAAMAALSELRRVRGQAKDAESTDREAFAAAAASGKKPPATSAVETHRAELHTAERVARGHADACSNAYKKFQAATRAQADALTASLHEADQAHRTDLAAALGDVERIVDAIDEVGATKHWLDAMLDEYRRLPPSFTRHSSRSKIRGLGGRFDSSGTSLSDLIATLVAWTDQPQEAA